MYSPHLPAASWPALPSTLARQPTAKGVVAQVEPNRLAVATVPRAGPVHAYFCPQQNRRWRRGGDLPAAGPRALLQGTPR